ncbi:MAG: hypothetical protein EOR73_10145 [Mesorhizobium sp.]|nr:MAG: hypothetical protein EOR73_10145 [Mesorhizobium sp.]
MESTARHVDYTFPEVYTGHATYREPPFHLRDPFIEHVKQTRTPETFPGLYWGRLNKNEPFDIIHTFAVDRKMRPGGDYIPCPMCQTREKFLEGSLVYIFKRQCIPVIGHDCASAEVKRAAFSKKKQYDARRQQEDFLMARLVHVPGMLRALNGLKKVASEIDSIFHTLKGAAPTIHKALRQVRKSGGEYMLYELIDNDAAKFDERLSKKVARDYYFGSLAGEALVRSNCNFLRDLRRYEQWLLSFDGCDNEEKALEMTIGLLERREAAKAVQYIGEAGRKLERLRRDMSSACLFFSDAHIGNLREWATHPLQPAPFTVERQVRLDGILLVFARTSGKDEEREYARLLLTNKLVDWADANRQMPALENL